MFTVISSHRAQHQLDHQAAMIDGFKSIGIDAVKSFSETHVKTKLVACWGWRVGKYLHNKGHDVLVMERGYIGDRFNFASLGWNGLNGRAIFPEHPDENSDRFNSMAEMKPWKDGGDYILIMGQVPKDQSLAGRDLLPWYSEMAKLASDHYKLPVKFRQHPDLAKRGLKQRPSDVLISDEDYQTALDGAALVITYNSNSAVDAVLNGVPALSFDRGSMAWDVTGHDIGDLIKPIRERWAHNLSYNQWSLSEIRSGKPLIALMDMIV